MDDHSVAAQFLDVFFNCGVPLVLFFVGWFVGRANEKRHYQSIHEREKKFLHQPAVTLKKPPEGQPIAKTQFVTGSVVISIDHFKRFMAALRLIFGGEVTTFSPLLDRARREAILRMKENCPDADLFVGMRIVTSSISARSGRDAIGTVEVVAYGTALVFEHHP
ncbi:MAG: heavy metal-binding domain-containing protein [Polyangiales bacterium]